MRIVSLTCSNTELVCALGREAWLVGCDDHSDHPAEVVSRLPRVGKDLDVDASKVAALKPDLVLASLTVPGHEKVVERLANEKLDFLVLAPQSVADVARDLRLVGRVLAVPERGEALSESLLSAMRPPLDDGGRRPRLLVEWWPKPCIAAGTQSWVEDMLAAAGADNALQENVESKPMTPSDAAALAPDAVVISWCGVPASHYRPSVVLRRQGWGAVPAVQNQQVHPITEAWLGRPGPRLLEGLEALKAVVASVKAQPGWSEGQR
jgi:iron complex transport system substrate-binding protein